MRVLVWVRVLGYVQKRVCARCVVPVRVQVVVWMGVRVVGVTALLLRRRADRACKDVWGNNGGSKRRRAARAERGAGG